MRLRVVLTLAVMLLRPVHPEDATRVQAFVRRLSPRARLERFFAPMRELTEAQLERMTHNPGLTLAAFDRHGAIVALGEYAPSAPREPGFAPGEAEFALAVADAWQHQGLGGELLARLMEHAAARGFVRMSGFTRESNRAMRALAEREGFVARRDADPAFVRLHRALIHSRNKTFLERNSAITSTA